MISKYRTVCHAAIIILRSNRIRSMPSAQPRGTFVFCRSTLKVDASHYFRRQGCMPANKNSLPANNRSIFPVYLLYVRIRPAYTVLPTADRRARAMHLRLRLEPGVRITYTVGQVPMQAPLKHLRPKTRPGTPFPDGPRLPGTYCPDSAYPQSTIRDLDNGSCTSVMTGTIEFDTV